MLLKNNIESFGILFNTVQKFYINKKKRVIVFDTKEPSLNGGTEFYVRFLLERKHVVEYKVVEDRGFLLSVISLAIGPNYFSACDFWDYENAQRFILEASTDAIEKNLTILDEYFESR